LKLTNKKLWTYSLIRRTTYATLAQIYIHSARTVIKTISIIAYHFASTSIHIANHFCCILIIGALAIAGIVIWIVPNIRRTRSNTILMIVEIISNASHTCILTSAFKTWRDTYLTGFVVKHISLCRTCQITAILIYVRVKTWLTICAIYACFTVLTAHLTSISGRILIIQNWTRRHANSIK
jgi:hypothetical protein